MSDDNDILTPPGSDGDAPPEAPAEPRPLSRTTIGAISGIALTLAVVGVVALRGGSSEPTTNYAPPVNALFTGVGGELVAPGAELETYVRLPAGMAPVGDVEITGDAVGHFVVLEDKATADDDGRQRIVLHISNTDEIEHRFEGKVWFRMHSGEQAPIAEDAAVDALDVDAMESPEPTVDAGEQAP